MDGGTAAGGQNAATVAGGRNPATAAGARNDRALQTRQSAGPAAGGTAHGGVRKNSLQREEVDSLLQCIRRVVPIGNDPWELVVELHSIAYDLCGCPAESIERKFTSLANRALGTGNPSLPPHVALAKEIHEAINSLMLIF